jgi:ubiquitin-protein ligase/transcription elongation factor Elf1
MITFSCDKCGKAFSVDDKLAGRKGKCKACGAPIEVPAPRTLSDEDVSSWLDDAVAEEAAATTPQTWPASNNSIRQSDLLPPSAPPARPKAAPSRASDRPSNASASTPPSRATPAKGSPAKSKPPVRTRRLTADAELMAKALANFPLIRVHQTTGNPPEIYQIIYHVRGLARGANGQPITREAHVVEIQLTRDYPRQSPKCRMLTPIFHPNIEPATICVGDHWTAGERLVDLVIRIGEMIAYQAYNIQSPLDGEAAMWADQNARHLPVDLRDLHPPELD